MKQPECDLEVPGPWHGKPNVTSRHPVLDPRESLADAEWTIQHAWARRQPDESEHGRSTEADLLAAVHQILPPPARLWMLGEALDVCVQQEVDVRDDHCVRRPRSRSTSTRSSRSSTSAFSFPRSRPGSNRAACGRTR